MGLKVCGPDYQTTVEWEEYYEIVPLNDIYCEIFAKSLEPMIKNDWKLDGRTQTDTKEIC